MSPGVAARARARTGHPASQFLHRSLDHSAGTFVSAEPRADLS